MTQIKTTATKFNPSDRLTWPAFNVPVLWSYTLEGKVKYIVAYIAPNDERPDFWPVGISGYEYEFELEELNDHTHTAWTPISFPAEQS